MRLSHIDLGSGRPLFLVPGWGMSAELLRPWAEQLEGWQVRLVDLPGQGAGADAVYELESLATDLVRAAQPGAVWLGWSLGVPLLLEAARHTPPTALVLVSGGPRLTAAPGWAGVAAAELERMREGLKADPQAVWRGFLRLLASQGRDSRGVVRRIRQTQADPTGIRGLASGLRVLAEADLREYLPALNCPVHWLIGDSDPLVPTEGLAWAAQHCPRGELRVLDQAGHFPFWTHGEACAQELGRALERAGQ